MCLSGSYLEGKCFHNMFSFDNPEKNSLQFPAALRSVLLASLSSFFGFKSDL